MRWWDEAVPELTAFAESHRVLLAGAGEGEPFRAVRADLRSQVQPDVVLDLNAPLPFAAATFDGIYAFSVLEHLDDTLAALGEFHRIVRPGGRVVLLVPHFANAAAFTDPTHRRFFSASSFDYVVPDSPSGLFDDYGFYESYRYRYRRRLLMLERPWNLIPGFQSWVNRHVSFYERHLCFFVRPSGIYVELEKQ